MNQSIIQQFHRLDANVPNKRDFHTRKARFFTLTPLPSFRTASPAFPFFHPQHFHSIFLTLSLTTHHLNVLCFQPFQTHFPSPTFPSTASLPLHCFSCSLGLTVFYSLQHNILLVFSAECAQCMIWGAICASMMDLFHMDLGGNHQTSEWNYTHAHTHAHTYTFGENKCRKLLKRGNSYAVS
jgi:hypothetical protein